MHDLPIVSPAAPQQQNWAEPDLLLMADPELIESSEGATRFELCPLEKHPEPVLRPTAPWEGGDGENVRAVHQDPLDGSVFYDDAARRFVCWYCTHNRMLRDGRDPAIAASQGGRHCRQGSIIAYATSEDGLMWQKPALGRVWHDGSTANNLVALAVGPVLSDALGSVVRNHHDRSPGAPRWLASVYSEFNDPIYARGIALVHSDDGADWQAHWPPVLPLDGDAHCLMWDARQQCYLCTTRSAAYAHTIYRLRDRGYRDLKVKRHIALARSADAIHWTPMMPVLEVDEHDLPNAELYAMYVVPYGHVYIGFLLMFYPDATMSNGPLEVQLAVSRDLMRWQRIGDRKPFLPRGPEGAWDQGHVKLSSNPPFPIGENLMRFWYGGKDSEHWQAGHAAMGTATLRRDGFACWSATAAGGTVTTCPLQMRWATMPMLNVQAAAGEARLEILDPDGRPITGCAAADCLPIIGDHVRAIVQFRAPRGNFIRHSGNVRLRFHLRNARLFAIKAPNVTLLNA